jgi:hypothetical protein
LAGSVRERVKSLPAEQLAANSAILARLGEKLPIPLLISSTREDEGFLGTTIEELQRAAPSPTRTGSSAKEASTRSSTRRSSTR